MKYIEIESEEQKTVFTSRSVETGGEEFLYSDIDRIDHSVDQHKYLVRANGREVSVPYEDTDAKTIDTLFSRIGELRGLAINELTVTEPEKTAASEEAAEVSRGFWERPAIIIAEAAIALILLALGIWLLFIAY